MSTTGPSDGGRRPPHRRPHRRGGRTGRRALLRHDAGRHGRRCGPGGPPDHPRRPGDPRTGSTLHRHRPEDGGRVLAVVAISWAGPMGWSRPSGPAWPSGSGSDPVRCHQENPRLVYGRATGWGQQGPWKMMAGHDINYIALAGVLGMIGPEGGAPVPPLNLVGDFGGGGLLLAFGMVCALLEARGSGVGQVVDGAMVDGSALLATMFFEMSARGRWTESGAQRARRWRPLLRHLRDRRREVGGDRRGRGPVLVGPGRPARHRRPRPPRPGRCRSPGPKLRARIAAAVAARTRDEWAELAAGTDTCMAPILSLREAPDHPHHRAPEQLHHGRRLGATRPGPRFSRSVPRPPTPPPAIGSDARAVLSDWGVEVDEIVRLEGIGAFRTRN